MTQLMNGFGERGMSKLFEDFSEFLRGLFIAGLVAVLVTNGPLGMIEVCFPYNFTAPFCAPL